MRKNNGFPVVETTGGTGTLAAAAVAANTSLEQTITVPGANINDFVVVRPSAAVDAGLIVGAARVSAANTVKVNFGNTTAGALPLVALTFDVMCLPSEN